MNFVVLTGPPAVGKLTIARELAARTGYRVFHNHLAVDLALSLYEFGTPGFIALREEAWWAGIRRALADGRPGLIFTFNPENSVSQRFIDELLAEVTRAGAVVSVIELTAGEEEIERRLGADSRHRHGKLVDVALYRRLREAGTFRTPKLPNPRLRIDTEALPPLEAAGLIAQVLPRG